jgi:hypothetical protein
VRELLYLAGPTPQTDDKKRWFVSDEGDERLRRDRELIRKNYSDLKYKLNHRLKTIFLDGTITLRAECRIPTRIRTRVTFPDSYPDYEPTAYETGNLFPHTSDRHFFPDGRCCLWLPVETQWKPLEPTGLHYFLDQVSTFYERQLIYEASPDKRWPWGQRGHDIHGYIEFVQDTLGIHASLIGNFIEVLSGRENISPTSKCLCGSGKKYKYCHHDRVVFLLERLRGRNPFVTAQYDAITSG